MSHHQELKQQPFMRWEVRIGRWSSAMDQHGDRQPPEEDDVVSEDGDCSLESSDDSSMLDAQDSMNLAMTKLTQKIEQKKARPYDPDGSDSSARDLIVLAVCMASTYVIQEEVDRRRRQRKHQKRWDNELNERRVRMRARHDLHLSRVRERNLVLGKATESNEQSIDKTHTGEQAACSPRERRKIG